MNPLHRIMGAAEAARRWGLAPHEVEALCEAGRLEAVRLDGGSGPWVLRTDQEPPVAATAASGAAAPAAAPGAPAAQPQTAPTILGAPDTAASSPARKPPAPAARADHMSTRLRDALYE